MLIKNKKLLRLRRKYKAKELFFYEPDMFLDKIHLLGNKIEHYYEFINNIRLLEKEASLLENLYRTTEQVERLIYKITDESITDVKTQDDFFGELAEDITEILPLLGSEAVISLTTETDKHLDDLLEDMQEKIYSESRAVREVGDDLYQMLIRAY